MAERRIKDRTNSGKFHPQKSRGAWSNYEPSYAAKQGRMSPVTLRRARGSSGMMEGMTGTGSFSSTEMKIAMAFATSRHARIARFHNEQGVRYKGGIKIRHFLYLSKVDIRAIVKAVSGVLGFKLVRS